MKKREMPLEIALNLIFKKNIETIKVGQDRVRSLSNLILEKEGEKINELPLSEIEKKIYPYVDQYLYNSIRNNNTILIKELIFPYKHIYERVNEITNTKENAQNYDMFIRLVIHLAVRNSETENIGVTLTNLYRKALKMSKQPVQTSKENKKTTKKENAKNPVYEYLWKRYAMAPFLFQAAYYAIPKEIREKLSELNEDNVIYFDRQIKRLSRFYFLLKDSGYNNFEITQELMRLMEKSDLNQELKIFREKYLKNKGLNSDIIEVELKNVEQKEEEKFQILRQFLGISVYLRKQSLENIERIGIAWIEQIQREKEQKYTIYKHFLQEDALLVTKIIGIMKYEYPEHYQIFVKAHGESLRSYHPLNKEEQNRYELAINETQKILKKVKKGQIKLDEKDHVFIQTDYQSTTIYDELVGYARKRIDEVLKQIHNDDEIASILKEAYGTNFDEIYHLPLEKQPEWKKAISRLKTILETKNNLFAKLAPAIQSDIENAVKELDEPHKKVILKVHGPSLLENHYGLDEETKKIYLEAIEEIKVKSNYEMHRKSLIKPYEELQAIYPGIDKEQIIAAIELLGHYYPKQKERIIERLGEDYQSCNEMSLSAHEHYKKAIKNVQKIIDNTFEPKRILGKSIEMISPGTPREEIISVIQVLGTLYPKQQQWLYKKFGPQLDKNGEWTQEESKQYFVIKKNIQKLLNGHLQPHKNNFIQIFQDLLNEYGEETVLTAITILQKSDPKLAEIIYKRHGTTLQENSSLQKNECILYEHGVKKMTSILNDMCKTETLKDLYPEVSIEELKEKIGNLENVNDRQILYKRYGENLNEIHDIENKDQIILLEALTKLKEQFALKSELLKFFPKKDRAIILTMLELEDPKSMEILKSVHGPKLNYQREIKPEEQNQYKLARKRLKKIGWLKSKLDAHQNLFAYKLGEESQVRLALKALNREYPELYKIIIKRHNEDFLGINPLNDEEKVEYFKALTKIYIMSPRKSNTSLEKYSIEQIQEKMALLKTQNPNYYEILVKYHGTNFESQRQVSKEDITTYWNARAKLSRMLGNQTHTNKFSNVQTISYQELLKKTLKKHQKDLAIIKAKRRQEKTIEISKKYGIEVEVLYRIYAQNLLFFGNQIPEILREIIQNSKKGRYYLLNSIHMRYLINHLSPDEIQKWLEEIFVGSAKQNLRYQKALIKLQEIATK